MANGECREEDSFTVKELRIIEWKLYRVMTSSFSPHDSPNLLTGRRPDGRAGGRSSSSLIEQDVVYGVGLSVEIFCTYTRLTGTVGLVHSLRIISNSMVELDIDNR